jgi:hypothetical protein
MPDQTQGNPSNPQAQPPAPSNQQQATALLSEIPLSSIIGGPLKAAVDAQATAASACYDFVSKVGWTDNKDDKGVITRKVNDITFTFERTDAADANKKNSFSITIPVLTIMPIPFIRIESMTVNFKASISAVNDSSQQNTSSTAGDGKLDLGVGLGPWKVGVTGGISSKKDSTATSSSKYSVEHTMDISVHAVQDDMPAGMAKLLELMTRSVVVNPSTALPAPETKPNG